VSKQKKMSLKKSILDLLEGAPSRYFKPKEVARRLSFPKAKYAQLRSTLREMAEEGNILRFKKNRYSAVARSSQCQGKLHVQSQGYGFVSRSDGPDIFVSKKNMGTALHGDVVRARLFANTTGKNPEGMVVEVVQRDRKQIVGTFRYGRRFGYVIPDDLKVQVDIVIDNEQDHNAQDGQKVVTEITEWEHAHLNPIGHIVRVLGFPGDAGVDILSLVHDFQFETQFPDNVLKAVETIPRDIPEQEVKKRLDLRDAPVLTIDPEDAKDFDDAISIERKKNGGYRLGVHIADVSFYVKENSGIDQEAGKRGTSVYLVDRVIPMLPEQLSNSICSLVEGEDRLTFSVIIDLAQDGKVESYDILPSVIQNKRRFNYREAQAILDGDADDSWSDVLTDMRDCYERLKTRRKSRGSIDFETLDLNVELDEKGHPIRLMKKSSLTTNRMIEEFMLLANETVARHVGVVMQKQHNQEFPFVYRIHEQPDRESVEEFLQLTRAFGFDIKMPKKIRPRFFQDLTQKFKEHPSSSILTNAMIRTMMKAQYSTNNVGHFGLAYHYYTHFTSPIRRYPDLMVHRLLKRYHNNPQNLKNQTSLDKQCEHSTECEIRAMQAERDSIKLKQVEFMEDHLGEIYTGYISRIVNFGIFVHLPQFLLDGLVHVSDLDDDYYVYDDKNFVLIGTNQGRVFRLGDKITVKVSRVSRDERIVDFILASSE
jgi:ribonuclease R